MLRKLLGFILPLTLPSLLVAQAPRTPAAAAKPAVMHGIATQVQGEVVTANDLDGLNNQEGVDEVNGQNNDGQHEDGEVDQEGVNEPDGLNNDVNAGEQVDQVGDNEHENADTPPAPPTGTGPLSRIGRHKP